jgi:hypothetical protein
VEVSNFNHFIISDGVPLNENQRTMPDETSLNEAFSSLLIYLIASFDGSHKKSRGFVNNFI